MRVRRVATILCLSLFAMSCSPGTGIGDRSIGVDGSRLENPDCPKGGVSPPGRSLLSMRWSHRLALVELVAVEPLDLGPEGKRIQLGKFTTLGVSVSPDGSLLALGSGGLTNPSVQLVDLVAMKV